MESLEETVSNRVDDKSDENKSEDNSLKENDVQEPLPKKKFANTNFALKMKNKRKEEKLNNVDPKEALDSCKQVSIDVKRMNSNPVPKLINAVESKNRKRKRSQWKLGVMKKKKKPLGKHVKLNPLSVGLINGNRESNHISENDKAAESVEVKKEEPIHPDSEKKKQTNAPDSESLQRRRSLRSVTSSTSDTSFCEPETKVDLKPEKSEEDTFSCSRTKPFIGKLITKEARDEIANRILKGEVEPKAGCSNETSEKAVTPENKESKTEDVNKSLSESNTNTETNDKADKKAEKSAKQVMMDTDEKEVIQPSRKSTLKLNEAKESVKIEEPCCSRTMPFVGKTARKLPAGVPDRPIEIDSSTNQSDANSSSKDDTINLMNSSAAEKCESNDSLKDINENAESSFGIKILSVSSLKDDESVKNDFPPEKVDEPAEQTTSLPLKDTTADSDSSNKINMDSGVSTSKTRSKSRLAKSKKLDAPLKNVEEQSDSLSEAASTSKETRSNSGSVKRRSSLRSGTSVKSDSISEDFDSKSTTSNLEDQEDPWSCRRVIPFLDRKTNQLNKQLVAENVPNQMEETFSTPNISLVSSGDLTAPPESVADRLVTKENSQVDESISQNKVENDVKSKDSEKAETKTTPSNDLDSRRRSSTGSPVLNGEWKFRRKRRILSSDDESQEKEKQKTKKVKPPPDVKAHVDKKPATPLPSPGKTICSFLSTKCTKHDHQSPNGKCPAAPKDVKPKALVLLTRLEDMKDPEVEEYLKKTDLGSKIKKNYRRIVNKVPDEASKSDRVRSISTSTQATKDDLTTASVPAQESDSSASFRPSKESEDTSSQSTATSASISRRRLSSRASSESPILHAKRKKRPVNYLEDFSDTDEDKVSSPRRLLRSQQSRRGSMMREPDKPGAPVGLESDENDMEVEEFSRVGRQNTAVESNQEDSEQDANSSKSLVDNATDEFKKATARCKSVAERKISVGQRYPTRSKTPHIGMTNASEIDPKKLQEDIERDLKNMEEQLNKEIEKRTNLAADKKTPSRSRQVSCEGLPSTPIVPASKSMTPKKILGTPQADIASPWSSRSTTPRRSASFQKNDLLAKVTKSASELMEADRKKEMEIKDIRVQLIKLEAVCSDYKDYSAGEIELLTNKYIDMLMNSNFACDTWRAPIKFTTPYTRTVDLDGDEGDYDFDSQEPLPFEEVQVPMDSAEVDFDTTAEQNAHASPKRKSPKKSNKEPSEFEAAIASLSQNTRPLHEKTFGAINISEVLSQPAASVEDAENNRTIDSNAEESTNENDESAESAKVSDMILVNGTKVHACTFCNKIFVEKELLQKHVDDDHKSGEKSSSSTTASKTTAKQAPGPASSKKTKQTKFRYNESLKCTICSETYETKELLFDHIMKHNENDLQQAYKAAKLKQGETENPEEQVKEKKQKKSNHRKSTDSASTTVSGEEPAVDARPTTSIIDAISQLAPSSDALVAAQPCKSSGKALTVCQCHAHELTTPDLQVEMVLLCTSCNVIYRRRDCFEVHFRNNTECRRKRSNSEPTKAPKLFCSGCRCILNSLIEMRSHLEEHATKNCSGTVTFLCNICKVAFFGVGGIFYSHWFNHAKSPNFVASRYSFPKLSVVSVLEDVNGTMTTSKSQEGFFYIAEHVCRECRLPFSSDPELQKHKQEPCQTPQSLAPRPEPVDKSRLQTIKLICDLCKKYYVSKDNFDKHCNDRNHLKTPITKFSRLPINATDQVFVCSLCRGLSKTLDEMKEHWKRVHSPIMELYTCKTCNVVPSNDVANYTYDKFERHCRQVHKTEVITCLVYFVTARYVCNICKFGFETEKSMKEHELVHQKKTAVQDAPSQASAAPLAMREPQNATFYLAEDPQPDGGRRLHPVVVQYANGNGTLVGQQMLGPLPNQPQLQLPSQITMPLANINSQIVLPSSNMIGVPNTTVSQDMTSELRKALTSAFQGQAQQQGETLPQQPQPQSNANKVVETIELDSRSNSPVLDSSAPSTSSNSNALAAAKKAYMTKVNPNFESILTTTGSQATGNSTTTPSTDKSRPSRDENATPAEVDTLTPQPFEVVLVTDELSENSNQDKNENLGATSDEQPQQQPEIIETKSFLRVRSVAELQSIKIHLCAVCGLNFDTPHAFEQHEKTHRSMGEVGRSTPVQMISPMVVPNSKEPTNDPHSVLLSQMKQKLALTMANGPPAPSHSTNLNTRVMPNVLPHAPVLPPQQQQSWYPTSSNNTTSTMSNANYAANQSMQPRQQQQQHHSVLRQAINAPLLGSSYTTVRPPPPVYPGPSSSMVAPGRPSAIQLPERSTTGNIPPHTKRPSGAATRIPQQSLPSYDDVNNRQTGGTVTTYNTAPQQPVAQKSYGTVPNTVNYTSDSSPVNYQSVPQPQPRQQQPQKNIIYTCKHPNCFYRSASLAGIRAHETIHLLPQHGSQQPQQMPTTSTNQLQQQQMQQMQQMQQQQQAQRLPVSQMPERTRHAVPTGRVPAPSNNQDKRITCRICNKNCSSSINLIEHVSTVHSGANQVCCYVCDYCPSPLIFDTEDQLRKHMNISHNHSCEFCNKRYPSKEDLMVHMEVHMRRA